MRAIFTIRGFLADLKIWVAGLLILALLLPPSAAHADDNTMPAPLPLINGRPDNSALASAERDYQRSLLLAYIHRQGPALVPGLPEALREPADFILRQLRSADAGLGLDGDPDSGGTISSFLAPVFSLMRPADDTDAEAFWLVPGYHHARGMLPLDDALMFGFNYRNSLLSDRVKFNLHPFYAQSWHGAEGYWGTELALGIGPAAGHSWGKIVLRYDNGSSALMDSNAHGFDLHTDLLFDEHLSFSAGVQQNEASDLGNYALLRWRMRLGE